MGDHRTTSAVRKIALFAAAVTAAGLAGAPAPAQAHTASGPLTSAVVLWASGSSAGGLDALERAVSAGGADVVSRLPLAGALVVDIPAGWQPPAGAVVAADRPLTVTSNSFGPADEPPLRGTLGVTSADDGAGVTVALVDTGVADVPDLAGSVDHINVSGAPQGDGFGHGTFLAGVIAAHGKTTDAPVRGVAPAARILDVQVADAEGSTSLVRVINGLEQVSRRAAEDPSLRIVNLSLSSPMDLSPSVDPLARSLEALWDQGLVVVVAAGNEGQRNSGVTSPASDPVVLSVGALDESGTSAHRDDNVAGFSSRGSRFGTDKPEVVAPGVSIVGLRAPGSLIDREHPDGRVGTDHFRGSGTSMAAAAASGLAADLIAGQPALTPDDVKDALAGGGYSVDSRRSRDNGAPALSLPGARAVATVTVGDNEGPGVHDAWADFARAWTAGSYDDAAAAWAKLPRSLQDRAAWAWATSVAADELATPEQVAQARQWAQDHRGNVNWLARAWSARAWSSVDWTARAWSARAWSARAWSARAWSARAWSARAWSARAWSARAWSARAWSARAWSARSWSADSWADDTP